MNPLLSLLFSALLSLSADPVPNTPPGTLLQAEAHPASDSRKISDPAASDSAAVSNPKPWQPLFSIDTPADTPTRIYLHLRHRGGPIQLKTLKDGTQKERDWIWAKPTEWTWSRLGPYTRDDLGTQFLLMRGDGDGEVALDCIVLANADPTPPSTPPPTTPAAPATPPATPILPPGISDATPATTLPPAHPDPAKPAVPVAITIDWATSIGKVPPALWGVNDYEALLPTTAADPGFHTALQSLRPPLIRLHHGDLTTKWLDESQTKWDVEKIRAALAAASPGLSTTPLMLNIPSWPPTWSDADGVLKKELEPQFAALLVDLMRIFRDELHRPVAYWEVLNERDGDFYKKNSFDDVCRIYLTAVRAMKKFDPTAQVGGFAFTWANPEWVNAFVKSGAAAESDFLTYHNYGIGEVTDSNEKLFSTLASIESHARFIRDIATKNLRSGKGGPVFLSEFNVKWVWEPLEPRHANSVGAAFQASLLRRAALAGIDGALVWHLKGNAYGLFDGNNAPRLTSHLFRLGPQYLTGTLVKHPDATSSLELLPVIRPNGKRSLLLINKSDHTILLPPATSLLPTASPLYQYNITASGASESPLPPSKDPLPLPGFSLLLLVEQ